MKLRELYDNRLIGGVLLLLGDGFIGNAAQAPGSFVGRARARLRMT